MVIHYYSLRPAQPITAFLLGHMLLHDNGMHLLGNMVFLLLIGFVVEAVLGSGPFLLLYLVAGLGSAAIDMTLHPEALNYHLGASDAIAGQIGRTDPVMPRRSTAAG